MTWKMLHGTTGENRVKVYAIESTDKVSNQPVDTPSVIASTMKLKIFQILFFTQLYNSEDNFDRNQISDIGINKTK